MKRLDQLTFFRFLAALMIILFHYGRDTYPFTIEPWKRIPNDGPFALSFFFVLSGFILTYVYARRDSRELGWKNFVIRRVARFYPLYLLTVLITVPFRFGESPHTLLGLVLEIFLLQSWVPPFPLAFNGPAWAMSAFFLFYLVFPPLLAWLNKRGLNFSIIFITGFWLVSQVAIHLLRNLWYPLHTPVSHDVLHYNPIFHLNTFLVGVLGAFLFIRFWQGSAVNQRRNLFWMGVTLVLMTLFIFYRGPIQRKSPFALVLDNGLVAPLYLLVIIVFARDDTRVSKFLSLPVLVWLGELSFTLYLWQSPMVRIYQRFLLARLEYHFPWTVEVHFYIYLALLFPAVIVTYLLFEVPVQRFIRRWVIPKERASSAAP